MKRINVMALAILAALALSGVASGSASAACKEHHTLCVEGKQVGSAEKPAFTPFTVVQKAGSTQTFSDPGQNWTVTCPTLKGAAPKIESAGAGSLKLTTKLRLEGCKAQLAGKEEPACKVQEIGTSGLTGAFGTPIENLKLTPNIEEFMEITITGCVLNNNWFVYGSEECTVKPAETETVTKELLCEAAKSKMELRHGQGGAVTLALDGTIELAEASKGKKFSFVS